MTACEGFLEINLGRLLPSFTVPVGLGVRLGFSFSSCFALPLLPPPYILFAFGAIFLARLWVLASCCLTGTGSSPPLQFLWDWE